MKILSILAVMLTINSVAYGQGSDLIKKITQPIKELAKPLTSLSESGSTQGDSPYPVGVQRIEQKKGNVGIKHIYIPNRSSGKIQLVNGILTPGSAQLVAPYPVTATLMGPIRAPGNIEINVGKGRCNIGGSAIGNVATDRVFVEIHEISCVKQDGTIWEFPIKAEDTKGIPLGYLFGETNGDKDDNYFGIIATRVSKEGELLLLKQVVNTIGEYAKAVADAEVSQSAVAGQTGTATSSNVTGNKGAYYLGSAIGKGTAPDLKDFISGVLKDSMPYYYVPAATPLNIMFTQKIDVTDLVAEDKEPIVGQEGD